MAEEKGGHDPMHDVFFIGGILVVAIALWFVSGGPERADLRGIFLSPPTPIGTGDAYGPQVGEPAPWAPTSTNQQ
jgi:hypothetical protein